VQEQILLGNKSNKAGVSVSANFGGGIIIGLLRPYELQAVKFIDSTEYTIKYIKYNSADSALFLTPGDVGPAAMEGFIGGPDFGQGWNDLSVVPGLYAKTSLRFDYGRYNETVSAWEVGLTAELYNKKIPQVVFAKQQQFFLSAYVSLMFGSRK